LNPNDPVDAALILYPEVCKALDAAAVNKLRVADQDRAVEVIEEIGLKSDVANPSAFVTRALMSYPHKRGQRHHVEVSWAPQALGHASRGNAGPLALEHLNPNDPVDSTLMQHSAVGKALDAAAVRKLRSAHPDRAVEIIEEISAKTDVANPSAFVTRALMSYPNKRGHPNGSDTMFVPRMTLQDSRGVDGHSFTDFGANGSLDAALAIYPTIGKALDAAAIRRLRIADPERAVEIIEEMGSKTDVTNPSAFVTKALMSYPRKRGHPNDVEASFARYPDIQDSLDDAALLKLRSADPARAVEIIEEVAVKGDVQNVSAFVVKALGTYPHKRGTPKTLAHVLARHPQIRDALDDVATMKLGEADQERAIEIIEDIAAKGDVRNPSAFAARSLQAYPHKRGSASDMMLARRTPLFFAPMHGHSIAAPVNLADRELSHYPMVAQALDAEAFRMLRQANPERAIEIIRDVAGKHDVRNPSAFVMQALRTFPQRRGDLNNVESALSRHPRIRAALDEAALQKLRDADPARAVEVIEDVAAKMDLRNTSAFIVKALATHPQKRGHDEYFGGAQPRAKQFRTTGGWR